jgi:hypothetical protein
MYLKINNLKINNLKINLLIDLIFKKMLNFLKREKSIYLIRKIEAQEFKCTIK